MRYRRATYRYSMVASAPQAVPLALDAFDGKLVRLAHRYWRPAADLYETPDAVNMTIDLAGVDPDELDIVLFDDAVRVEGQRRLTSSEPGFYHAAQIRQGPFVLELMLPARVDLERVNVRSERGLLTLTIPKRSGERDGH